MVCSGLSTIATRVFPNINETLKKKTYRQRFFAIAPGYFEVVPSWFSIKITLMINVKVTKFHFFSLPFPSLPLLNYDFPNYDSTNLVFPFYEKYFK